MGNTIFSFTCNLIIPVIMLLFGVKFRKQGPKSINGLYGYRTTMSMKNKDTWAFAHRCCGRLWIKLGTILLLLSIIASLIALAIRVDSLGILGVLLVTVQMVVLIASIFSVEKALKKNFDKDGKRRS